MHVFVQLSKPDIEDENIYAYGGRPTLGSDLILLQDVETREEEEQGSKCDPVPGAEDCSVKTETLRVTKIHIVIPNSSLTGF